jgi:hypothetical protein
MFGTSPHHSIAFGGTGDATLSSEAFMSTATIDHGDSGSSVDRHPPFLTTPRAFAACSREFARLGVLIADLVTESLGGEEVSDTIVVRQAPERCIVQVGSVALTVGWLRNTHDSVADGELLVIHWRGQVAPTLRHQPERITKPAAVAATALSESVYMAVATSESDWSWRALKGAPDQLTSPELARLLVDRLRTNYESAESAA